MALNVSFIGRRILCCQNFRPVSLCRTVTIEPKPYQPPVEEGYDERNMRLCRPQSPHLTIYRPQLTSMLSITHRMTGIILSGYATAFASASLLSSRSMGELITNISHGYPTFFLLFKLGLIFPFTYHFFNGIRHLVWDTGYGLTLKGVYVTGCVMLFFCIASALALVYYSGEKKN